MGIKLIINGYFRSGTTFVWNYLYPILKSKGFLSFYEPLLPYLGQDVNKERISRKINPLHSSRLYQDYNALPDNVRTHIFLNNPNANSFGIRNSLELKNYLDLYNEMSAPVFLQTNRLHFFFHDISSWYEPIIIHIIRNPLDVWVSIKNAYLKHNLSDVRGAKYIYYKLKRDFSLGQTFEIDKQFKWILFKVGLPVYYKLDIFRKITWRLDVFERFVVNWIVSNYFAIKWLKDSQSLLVYEHILNEPEVLSNRLSKLLKFDLTSPQDVKRSNFNKYTPKDRAAFYNVINKLKLFECWEYIKNRVNKDFNWNL